MIYNYYFLQNFTNKLLKGWKKKTGRNNLGRVCINGRGGGNKRLYRYIDTYRRLNKKGKVISIVYDPNRSARLALIMYVNSFCSYILLQKNVHLNTLIYSGTYMEDKDEKVQAGYSLPLKLMPLFSNISNIELRPFQGSALCKAAGTSCMLVGKIQNTIGILKLKSKWHVHVSLDCISSYGSISNQHFNNLFITKAGQKRAFGWKPKVRGVAKNPCDHPHGGGNGKKPKPKIPVNAWHTVFKWAHTKHTKYDKLKRRKFKNINEN